MSQVLNVSVSINATNERDFFFLKFFPVLKTLVLIFVFLFHRSIVLPKTRAEISKRNAHKKYGARNKIRYVVNKLTV